LKNLVHQDIEKPYKMKDEAKAYVPKKGDIIEAKITLNESVLVIVQQSKIGTYIGLRGRDRNGQITTVFLELDTIELVGLSLERIEERDEKLHRRFTGWVYDNYKFIGDMSFVVLAQRIKDEVFAEVDK
jgi:hypothetical protein